MIEVDPPSSIKGLFLNEENDVLDTFFGCRFTLAALTLTLLAPVTLLAQERATAAEAQSLVTRAIALYDKMGKDAAFTAI